MIAVATVCVALALLPTLMIAINLPLFRSLPASESCDEPISVLIPARNEAATIARSMEAVLTNRFVDFELIVLDDHSTDATGSIVSAFAADDPRVRLIAAPPLPEGWNGKQHACSTLASHARHDLLMWIDADVTLRPDALVRIVNAMREPIDLLSGFPWEQTSGWLDSLLIPLIHFVLLGYLPLWRMRQSNDPRLGAGCGQLFIARRSAYEAVCGHSSIRNSRHDGVKLPRLFRRGGYRTDIFDATNLASCRMYSSAGETWRGLLKNADEGLATPVGIVLWTILLAGGSILPLIVMVIDRGHAVWLGLIAILLPIGARLIMARRFQQSSIGALLHPLGITLLLLIQWQSIVLRLLGRQVSWKGRA